MKTPEKFEIPENREVNFKLHRNSQGQRTSNFFPSWWNLFNYSKLHAFFVKLRYCSMFEQWGCFYSTAYFQYLKKNFFHWLEKSIFSFHFFFQASVQTETMTWDTEIFVLLQGTRSSNSSRQTGFRNYFQLSIVVHFIFKKNLKWLLTENRKWLN